MLQVLTITNDNQPIELVEKQEAHVKGLKHRAFSVMIFNSNGDIMLQQRAACKYHSPNLWTNATCGHPLANDIDTIKKEAEKRLFEEMGITVTLSPYFEFEYRAEFDNDLIENEYDYVFKGVFDGSPNLNPDEASSYKYISKEELLKEMKENSQDYTEWFKIIMDNLPK